MSARPRPRPASPPAITLPATAPITGAQAFARRLLAHGVRRIYLYPGGTIMPLLDACLDAGIEYVVARHEQGAGYAALAEARLTGEPQVAMVTSGPGVTNVLTVVADAHYDSTPLLVVTGQVGTADLLSRPHVRQRGFQEVPTPDLVKPIAKACLRPMLPDAVAPAFERAWRIASEGRPGPVVLDLPMDVQRQTLEDDDDEEAKLESPPPELDAGRIESLSDMLRQSQRPVLLAGQGVLQAHATEALRAIAERLQIPVASSLPGVGALPGRHPLCLGYIGHTGTGWANRALHHADLVVAIGARLDVRQTGTRTEDFVPRGRVVRIDVDRHELEASRVHSYLCIHADAREALELLDECLPASSEGRTAAWLEDIERWRSEMPLDDSPAGAGCHAAAILRAIDEATADRAMVCVTGVGQHQQWAARHLTFDAPRRCLLTSGGHGAMGYDLPSAVGAAFARPDDLVLCVVGDGSFQINMQELGTIAEYGLPVKVAVLDNQRLGIVSQFQNVTFGRDPSTGARAPFDFAAFARLYGIDGFTHPAGAPDGALIARFLATPGAALLHVPIDPALDVEPMLLAGQTLDTMWPRHRP